MSVGQDLPGIADVDIGDHCLEEGMGTKIGGVRHLGGQRSTGRRHFVCQVDEAPMAGLSALDPLCSYQSDTSAKADGNVVGCHRQGTQVDSVRRDLAAEG